MNLKTVAVITSGMILAIYGAGEYLKYSYSDSDVLKKILYEEEQSNSLFDSDLINFLEEEEFKSNQIYPSETKILEDELSDKELAFRGWSKNRYSYQELKEMNQDRKDQDKYFLSSNSVKNLRGIDKRLVDIVFEVLKEIPMQIVHGCRSAKVQNKLFKVGKSTKDGYIDLSNHQFGRSLDIRPLLGKEILRNKSMAKVINMYDKGRENQLRWQYFGGYFKGIAVSMGHKILWGGKWRIKPLNDLKRPQSENTLVDSNHFEIRD